MYIYRRASLYTLKGELRRTKKYRGRRKEVYSGEYVKHRSFKTVVIINKAIIIIITCKSFSVSTTVDLLFPTFVCVHPPISVA